MHTRRDSAGPEPAPSLDWHALHAPAHWLQLYRGDEFLVGAASRFVASGLAAGEATVVIATAAHLAGLEAALHRAGIDARAAREEGAYVPLDAAETLAGLLVSGLPDARCFDEIVGRVLEQAGTGARRVRAVGEMVALLWGEGRHEATLRLEALWNDLARRVPFTLVCAYPLDVFGGDAGAAPFQEVCAAHAGVLPTERYGALATPAERLREVAALEQRVSALEAEALGACQVREALLARLGHELRNPLAALRCALASAAPGSAGREGALEIAERQASQLGRMVDGIIREVRRAGGRIAAPPEAQARLPEAAAARETGPRCAAPPTGLRVLLVEDNRDVAETLTLLLEKMGHTVCVAYDGLSGLELVRSEPAEVALVDIGLPGIDGCELARRVRRDASRAGLVLVAITGYGEAADRRRALEAGFDHYFVKPVDISALHAFLAGLAPARAEASGSR